MSNKTTSPTSGAGMETQDLRKAGLKVTLPRIKILEMLENSDNRHLSAEDIYRMLMESGEEIGLATVYRVLTQFEAAGLVVRHHFEDGDARAVFELDAGEHHDHMVCVKTGQVIEFVDEIIEQRQREIAEKYGWEMTDHSLIIYGISPEAKKAKK